MFSISKSRLPGAKHQYSWPTKTPDGRVPSNIPTRAKNHRERADRAEVHATTCPPSHARVRLQAHRDKFLNAIGARLRLFRIVDVPEDGVTVGAVALRRAGWIVTARSGGRQLPDHTSFFFIRRGISIFANFGGPKPDISISGRECLNLMANLRMRSSRM